MNPNWEALKKERQERISLENPETSSQALEVEDQSKTKPQVPNQNSGLQQAQRNYRNKTNWVTGFKD